MEWKTVTLDKIQEQMDSISVVKILCGGCYFEISQDDFFSTSRENGMHYARYGREGREFYIIQVREHKTML